MDEREIVRRAAEALVPPEPSFDRLIHRRDRVQRNRRIRAGVVGVAIAIAVAWVGVIAIRSTPPVPVDRSEDLGIFAPVAGRIVYVNVGIDRGYGPGLWAVDPEGLADTTDGPAVADDVASTLVRLGLEGATPLGWSSDGTELLFSRPPDDPQGNVQESLYVLDADGTETRLNGEGSTLGQTGPSIGSSFGGATISPDGTRVVFARNDGLYAVGVEGGQPVRLGNGFAPTFSPDGTQIAYLLEGGVWVADADGSDAHEILAYEQNGRFGPGETGLQWSPAGDRLAIGLGAARGSDALAIYTFDPDGSGFTRVITGGISPYWSPDGSQIAYTILCGQRSEASCPRGSILRSQFDADPSLFGGGSPGLAIADADGSNVREFGFAASGPWHPGASPRVDADPRSPSGSYYGGGA